MLFKKLVLSKVSIILTSIIPMLVLLKLVLFKCQYYFKKLVLFFIVSIKKCFGSPYIKDTSKEGRWL